MFGNPASPNGQERSPEVQRFLADPMTRVLYHQSPGDFWKQYQAVANPAPPKQEIRQVGHQLVSIGQDGKPHVVYSAPQGEGGGVPKPPAGYRWTEGGSLEAIPGGPADKSGSANVVLGDPQATGESYLQTIPDAGLRQLIKGIADGRMQVPRIYRAGKAGEIGPTQIAAAVSQYDPTFNAQDYNSRNRTRIDFTSGKSYQNMTALNQVASHLDELASAMSGTAGSGIPIIGKYINEAYNATTDPVTGKVTTWNTKADAVAHEVRKLFAGSGGGTQAELDGYLKNLSASNSEAQKKAALQSLARLVRSRISILQQGYEQGMGKAGDPFQVAFPHGAEVLDTLSGDAEAQPAQNNGWAIQKVSN